MHTSVETQTGAQSPLHGWVRLRVVVAAATFLLTPCTSTWAIAPESPEVKRAVAKAIAHIEANAHTDTRPGAKALAGLAIAKNDSRTHGRDHPLVKEAITLVQQLIANDFGEDIYTLGIAIIFLKEVDAEKYHKEIDSLAKLLARRQKGHGGWGYADRETGDTSMTQYGVLSLWEASQAGVDVADTVWEKVANWLLRTQDPRGNWAYQGNDPGNFNLIEQSDARHSIVAAALGSLYIVRDYQLGGQPDPEETDAEVPAGLKRVDDAAATATAKRRRLGVDAARLKAAFERGNGWFEKNFTLDPQMYKFYYLYALERYQSFKALAERNTDREPDWYNRGAYHLIETQEKDGSWVGDLGLPDTAFAVLFLVRSARKSIEKADSRFGAGLLVGGRGLPESGELDQRLGQIIAKPLSGPADELLALMEDPNNPNFLQAVQGFADAALEADEKTLDRHAVRLRKLAGAASPEARIAAVKALGKARSLDNVPTLVYAMTDPDPRVVEQAREGLRFISRKLGPLPLKTVANPASKEEIDYWKAWFRSVRPDAEFEN